jgi:hypothetical protein
VGSLSAELHDYRRIVSAGPVGRIVRIANMYRNVESSSNQIQASCVCVSSSSVVDPCTAPSTPPHLPHVSNHIKLYNSLIHSKGQGRGGPGSVSVRNLLRETRVTLNSHTVSPTPWRSVPASYQHSTLESSSRQGMTMILRP